MTGPSDDDDGDGPKHGGVGEVPRANDVFGKSFFNVSCSYFDDFLHVSRYR